MDTYHHTWCQILERMVVELDNPFILITDKKVSSMKELLPVLEKTIEFEGLC